MVDIYLASGKPKIQNEKKSLRGGLDPFVLEELESTY